MEIIDQVPQKGKDASIVFFQDDELKSVIEAVVGAIAKSCSRARWAEKLTQVDGNFAGLAVGALQL